MSNQQKVGTVTYKKVDESYFNKRGLRRYAGVWSLWALGVGAVISGHFSGWNFGLGAGGFGGMAIATAIIAVMYLGLCFSLAEMSPALPHTGGAYSFARSAMGPWGGFLTGLAENLEFVITPAVIVFFIGSYLGGIFETGPEFQPVWWVVSYIIFVGLNLLGVELSFKVSLFVTLAALAILAVFWVSAITHVDFAKFALNIGADADGKAVELLEGNGSWMPFGWAGVLAAMPYAVWLFLAIEQLPLAAEESVDPKRDMPKGLLLGILTLMISATFVLTLNTSISPGAFKISSSGEPLLEGFRTIYGTDTAKILALIAVIGLIASFHTIIFAFGRQIYSLSRAGYFPQALSVTSGQSKVPYAALLTGAVIGLAVMMMVFYVGGEAKVGTTLLNVAVFGAMISYMFQSLSFILLRIKKPQMPRPYRSPFGIVGAMVTIIIAAITLYFQFLDPAYQTAMMGAAGWYVLGILYFAVIGRHKLVLSPEEEFALTGKAHHL